MLDSLGWGVIPSSSRPHAPHPSRDHHEDLRHHERHHLRAPRDRARRTSVRGVARAGEGSDLPDHHAGRGGDVRVGDARGSARGTEVVTGDVSAASLASSIAPMLSVRRGASAVTFYQNAFGAVETYRVESPDGAVVSRLSVNGAE